MECSIKSGVGRCCRCGFTLVELLVVVAVVAILAALLFPAFRSMVERAQGAGCLSNLRQLHVAIVNMASEDNGLLPLSEDRHNMNAAWFWYLENRGHVPRRVGTRHVLLDPGSKLRPPPTWTGGAYGINRNLVGPLPASHPNPEKVRMSAVVNPDRKFLLFCSGGYALTRDQAANPVVGLQYIPGHPNNLGMNWGERNARDALEGRHGRTIHSVTLGGNVEVWPVAEFPYTADRWVRDH